MTSCPWPGGSRSGFNGDHRARACNFYKVLVQTDGVHGKIPLQSGQNGRVTCRIARNGRLILQSWGAGRTTALLMGCFRDS
jgi:hypothetical protein